MVNRLMIRLMFRELRKNWFEYLSMLLITVLAVTLFLGFLSNSMTLDRRASLYYKESNLADLVVQTTGFTQEDRAYLDTCGAEYRIYSDGNFCKAGAGPETAKFYIGEGEINKPYITEGTAGLLVNARVAALRNYKVGDIITLTLTTLEGALAPLGLSAQFEAEITGLMHSVEAMNIFSSSPVFLTPSYFAEKSGIPEALLANLQTQALLLEKGNAAALKTAIQNTFAQKGAENNLVIVYDHDTMEAVVTIDSEVEQSLNMIYVFPVIFFAVSILVIMTSVSRLILRERTHIGTFKALGIGNGHIVFHYAFISALITFFGCALGAALGPLIVPTVMSIKYGIIFSMPFLSGIVVSAPWTIGTVIAVCLCSFLIGVWASRSVIRENPAECTRPKQITYKTAMRGGEGKGLGQANALLSMRMAVRNIRVGWGRALMTVVGIAGCSALLLTSFGIGNTLNASVQNDFGKLFTFDVLSPYTAPVATTLRELEEDAAYGIEKIELVESYVVSAQGKAERGKDITVYVLPADCEMAKVIEESNALSKSVAEDLGVKAGDTISLTFGGGSYEYRIERIVETASWNGFFTNDNKFEAAATSTTVWVRTSAPESVAERLNGAVGTVVAKTMAQRIEEIENVISSTNTMKYTLMVFAILLSVVVLYNLSLLNIKERTRDLATMKVLGFPHFLIALSLIFEIMLLTAVGTAVGCACGFPLLYLVMTINKVSVLSFVITLTPISYVLAVIISVATAAVINGLFGLLISRINMTESLKSVE